MPTLFSLYTPQELFGAGSTPGAGFGGTVSLSSIDMSLAAGCPGCEGGAGAVFRFDCSGQSPALCTSGMPVLPGGATSVGDAFGSAVSANGCTMAVGAPGAQGGSGEVFVFSCTAGSCMSPVVRSIRRA